LTHGVPIATLAGVSGSVSGSASVSVRAFFSNGVFEAGRRLSEQAWTADRSGQGLTEGTKTMTETDIAQLIAMNRLGFIGWLLASMIWTLGIFFLAYVIRNTPVFVRAAVFVAFLLGTFNFVMTMNIVNAGFLQLVQDLAAVSPQTTFSQNVIEVFGATPTQAPALPIWARLGSPLVYLLNVLVGFYLLLMAKWER